MSVELYFRNRAKRDAIWVVCRELGPFVARLRCPSVSHDVAVPSTGLPGVGGERGYELDDIAILRFVRFLGTNSRLDNLRRAAKLFRHWLLRGTKPSADRILLVRADGTLIEFQSKALAEKLNGDSFATIIHPHSLRYDLEGHSMGLKFVPPKRRGRPHKTTHQAKDGRCERER